MGNKIFLGKFLSSFLMGIIILNFLLNDRFFIMRTSIIVFSLIIIFLTKYVINKETQNKKFRTIIFIYFSVIIITILNIIILGNSSIGIIDIIIKNY